MALCENIEQKLSFNDIHGANSVLMNELGRLIIDKKNDFINVLNSSGVYASDKDTDEELINKFLNNAAENKKLLLNTSFLINFDNRKHSFEGDNLGVDDEMVKVCYKIMRHSFEGDYSSYDGDYSNYIGAIAGAVQGVAGAVQGGQQLRMQRKHGADIAQQQRNESRGALIQSAMTAKQQKAEAKIKEKEGLSKNVKIALIVGGSLIGIAIIGTVIYMIKNKK